MTEDESYPKQTHRELKEQSHQSINHELAQDLLNRVKERSPGFFEIPVVELLVKMGYRGSVKDAGQALGRSGDGGIDGVIKQDKLGLDNVYIQAKKWDGTVGRPEVQKFVGALRGKKAATVILITTSDLSNEARNYLRTRPENVVLIGGEKLAELMIEHDLGVTKVANYEIKREDDDYFSEE